MARVLRRPQRKSANPGTHAPPESQEQPHDTGTAGSVSRNFANFDLPGNTQSGILSGTIVNGQQVIASGAIGGTGYSHRTNQASMQSGTFALGAPRAIEFGLRFSF